MEEGVSEKFNCPVCFEIPETEIYQCRNGHMMCSGCGEILSQCPQCRVKMDSPKIRCRPLEDLLDMMRFGCANKSLGCTTKLKRYQIQDHIKSCTYAVQTQTIKLCEQLGYSCGFGIDTKSLQQAVAHLKTTHDFITCEASDVLINLQDFDSAESGQDCCWPPVVLDMSKEIHKVFLLLSLINRVDHTISFVCLEISEDSVKDVASEFKTNYIIRANNPLKKSHLNWTTCPLQAKNFAAEINEPKHKFSVSALRKSYVQDGVLAIKCSIQRNINFNDTVAGHTTIVCPLSICKNLTKRKLEISSVNFQSLGLEPSKNEYTPSTPPVSSTYYEATSVNQFLPLSADFATNVELVAVCGKCKTKTNVQFECLEACEDSDLCKHCLEHGKHKHHTFVMIQNYGQKNGFRTRNSDSRWKQALETALLRRHQVSSYHKISSDHDLNCSTRNCEKKKRRVCLDCPYLVGYCKACFVNVRHERNHCFAMTETKKKLRLVARVLFKYGSDPNKTMSRFVSSSLPDCKSVINGTRPTPPGALSPLGFTSPQTTFPPDLLPLVPLSPLNFFPFGQFPP